MSIVFRILVVVLLWCAVVPSRAQRADSATTRIAALQKRLNEEIDDTTRVETLNEIAYQYNKISPFVGLRYAQEAMAKAEEIGWKRGLARANSCLGANYFSLSNFPKAQQYWLAALDLNKELGNKEGIANHQHNVGKIYYSQGDYEKAWKYFDDALKSYNEIDKKMATHTYSAMGDVYMQLKNYPKALEFHNMALDIDKKYGNKSNIASDLMDIGNVYMEQGDYPHAIEMLMQAVQMKKETGDKNGLARSYNIAGRLYMRMGETDTQYVRTAIAYLDTAVEVSKEIEFLDNLQKCYQCLYDVYKKMGDYQQAVQYSDAFHLIKDSIYSSSNSGNILKQALEYDFAQQRKMDEMRNAEKLRRQRSLIYIGIAGIIVLLGFTFFIIKERRKSDELLYNIIPEEVAGELRSKGAIKARHYDEVTVMFTDFVGFTKASEKMSPQEIIDELDECFKTFDSIMEKYGIEKIKTIGDAYLAVSGLPVVNPNHAMNMVFAAKEVSSFMLQRRARLGDKTFEMRIGLHSGAVVAGIVGVKKFAYDIWGDTVNTAARIEQAGQPGQINLSQTTYELVKYNFRCTYRGEIPAKNKGDMKMYFVE